MLIVDDHENVRHSIQELLELDSRFTVVDLCANGAEAIISAGEKNPDVIIMDLNMYPVNGFEATRKIVKLYPNIKILAHSFHNDGTYPRNSIQSGAKGYLIKGADMDELYEAIIGIHDGHIYICKELRDRGYFDKE